MKIIKRPDLNCESFHGMMSCSPQMRRLFTHIERAANSKVTVLIRGQSGTGKELAAKALHLAGPRANKPFRAVNCATFTSEMLASELFGHVKGAFTGAVRDRDGLMALADHGTLFLDEVAEIPTELQGRLLRVLQERRFTPVGGSSEIQVDVRVVSATNASLRELVSARQFREDLMYRLRVVVLRLPPLIEREGDLELLTWSCIDRQNKTTGRKVHGIEARAWRLMMEYSWPGNIRELNNMLQAAYVLGEGPVLTTEDLAPELRGEGPDVVVPKEPNIMGLEDVERTNLLNAFDRCGGRRSQMAKELGISRSTLYRKLKQHGLI